MTKYLRCHTSGKYVTKGKEYEVISEEYRDYEIRDNDGDRAHYSKNPGGGGKSYRDWFTLETEAITLLPDESLGGILREYNEVKRKARVGERVRVFGHNYSGANGIFTVKRITDSDRGGIIRYTVDGDSAYGTPYIDGRAYVVLESSDVIRIKDERFRMVERKAAVGERVVVTEIRKKYTPDETLAVGQIGYCTGICPQHHKGSIDTTLTHTCGGFLNTERVGYAVLERVGLVEVKPPLSTLDPVDQYAENIAVLTTKVQALEKRVATLESAKVASGPVNVALPSFAKIVDTSEILASLVKRYEELATAPKKSPQQIRDEIVARAKADIERLKQTDEIGRIAYRVKAVGTITYLCDAEFVVNRDKRTVAVILRWRYDGKTVKARGIAKAAPGEVFNVHIGKAIALHRALGLVVPAEYMSVPAPTEVRAGDIIKYDDNGRVATVICGDAGYCCTGDTTYLSTARQFKHLILDDSREESEGVNA